MSYNEACEARVSRREAERELARHGWTWEGLRAETGEEPKAGRDGMYKGADVLGWLGY